MKAQSGFTLIELIIVVALIGLILAFVTLNFRQLNEKYRVESTAKEIHSMLMRARNDALATNTPRSVDLDAHQVQSGATILTYPRYTIVFDNDVSFDRRGLTNNLQTIRITGYSADITPAMDCLVISPTRINIGKWDESKPPGDECVQR